MPLTRREQAISHIRASTIGVPRAITNSLVGAPDMTLDAFNGLLDDLALTPYEAVLLRSLDILVETGTLAANVRLWVGTVRNFAAVPLLIRRVLIGASADREELAVLHGSIGTREVQELLGCPSLGFLYAGDYVNTANFWRRMPVEKVIPTFLSLDEEHRAVEILQARACARNGDLFASLDERAHDNYRVADSAVRNSYKAIGYVNQRLLNNHGWFDGLLLHHLRSSAANKHLLHYFNFQGE